MKRSVIFLFFLITISSILIFPLISAVEVSMNSNFSQGETFLAKFSGNFIDQITRDNVFFYRGHVKIPMIYDVVKINDEFYVYALLTDKNEGNYSINISEVRYMKGTKIISDPIESDFTISNETALFSVNPGALITGGDFSVELQNLQDGKITISITDDPSSIVSQTSLDLKSGEKKNLFFNVTENTTNGIANIVFSSGNFSYALPVYLDVNKTSSIAKDFRMEFQPSQVEISMATNSSSKRILYLNNTGKEVIKNIFFDVSSLLKPYVVISPESINSLDPNSAEKIEIQISSDLNEKVINGIIRAFTENLSTSSSISLNFIKDFVPATPGTDNTCSGLNGTICTGTQQCSGQSAYATDGVCCVAPGQCQQINQGFSFGKWIGWGLLLLVLIFLYWFYKKRYKRVARRKAF